MEPNDFSYHPIKGLKVKEDITLQWIDVGPIADKQTLERTRGAAGLYAFVLMPGHGEDRPVALYVGKAGGLKPKKIRLWANDIRTRAAQHWGTGPFRGLAIRLNCRVNLWIMNIRGMIDQVGERDIERIENEVIEKFKKWDANNIPGNTTFEGTSSRQFRVEIEELGSDPLPKIVLRPGRSEDTRNKRRRTQEGK
jgi:hypothetical protein